MDSETRRARRGHSSPCLRQTRSKEVQGTRFGIIAFVAASLALTLPAQSRLHETLANAPRPSPDDRWKVNWRCDERSARGPCTITLSRESDGQVLFCHSPFRRYIKAVWNRNSTKCLLLDAPDNANTFLWLFRIRNQQQTVEKVDYEAIR